MNPITCGMAADLLPLYLDGCCSADSRAALEAHMDTCPACRAQYAQLRRDLTPAAPAAEDPGTDGIARALARKMRRRKRCLRAFCAAHGFAFETFSAAQLAAVAGRFSSSGFVQSVTGVDNVCERSAVLGSGGTLYCKKQAGGGVTMAAAMAPFAPDWRWQDE